MRVGALRGFHQLQATGHKPLSKTPTPALPQGREDLFDVNCKPRASCRLQTAINESQDTTTGREPQLQATSYRPRAALPRFPGRGWQGQPRPGVHAVSNAEPRVTINGQLRATSYEPQAILLPSPRTTYCARRTTYLQGGHAGPPLRRKDVQHEPRATSYKPHATVSPFQPSEPKARAIWNVDRRSLRCSWRPQETMVTAQSPKHDFRNGPGPVFAGAAMKLAATG